MGDIKLEMSADQLKEIASVAIVRAIDDKAKDAMIAQAIAYLLKQKEGVYGHVGNSPIQTAFELALNSVITDVVRDRIKNDPTVKAKLEELIAKGFRKALEENEQTLVIGIAGSITSWLSKRASDD